VRSWLRPDTPRPRAVADYHLSVSTVSRSHGRSATAAAAYRAGERIADTRTGEVHDYRRKGGVESATLVLPDGAPAWAAKRAALWNAAEQAETRKNSCVAREFQIALPHELPPAERQRLAHDLAREIVARHGCAVDVAIHAPSKDGDQRNHHAHVLLSTRRLEREGFTDKTRELDDQKSGEVMRWRARWAELTNERLRAHGCDARVDHRSLEAQGIERAPTQHLGPTATAIERRTGEPSRRRQDIMDDRDRTELDEQREQRAAQEQRERQAQQEQKERQAQQAERAQRLERFARMPPAEQKRVIDQVRPRPVAELVKGDPAVMTAAKEVARLEAMRRAEVQHAADAQHKAEQWREKHKLQAWLHDRGMKPSKELDGFKQQHAHAQQVQAKAVADLAKAREHEQLVQKDAHGRHSANTLDARKLAMELEQIRREQEAERRAAQAHERGNEQEHER
jgi:hypothetical protein